MEGEQHSLALECMCWYVSQVLQDSGIPVPQHIIVDRDNLPAGQTDPGNLLSCCGESTGLSWRTCVRAAAPNLHAELAC